MDSWQPRASYPSGNFSDTSVDTKLHSPYHYKGSIGLIFIFDSITETFNQADFYPFILQKISVLFESTFGHLCYLLIDVPPQPNSQPENVRDKGLR